MYPSSVASVMKGVPEALLRNLLVAYDSSEASETALQYAIALAQVFSPVVTVVSVQSLADFSAEMTDGLGQMKEAHRQLTEELRGVSQRLEALGIRNRVMHRAGAVADVLVQLAAECDANLLLLGAYGHKKLDRPRLGSTAEFMLRSMACPVLTVGPGAVRHNHGFPPMRTLLYASSLPIRGLKARHFIQTLAARVGAHVEIIHVADDPSKPHDSRRHPELRRMAEDLAKELQQAGVEATWKLFSGPQVQRIVQRSDEIRADLIIFGLEHVPGTFEAVGTISATIWQAACPLLTIPGPA